MTTWRAFAVWVCVLVLALGAMTAYSYRPGVQDSTVVQWPKVSGIPRTAAQPTLLLFLHPKCACSRATLNELERLMPHLKDKVSVHILFADFPKPELKPDQSDLWRQAQRIPGVGQVGVDEGNVEQSRFGAKTSGQVYLFDEVGGLAFSGGITPSRGHMGDNAGRDAILQWMQHHQGPLVRTTPFGCGLRTLAILERK